MFKAHISEPLLREGLALQSCERALMGGAPYKPAKEGGGYPSVKGRAITHFVHLLMYV